MKYLLGFCLLILLASCDVHYQVHGRVIDAETGLGIDTFTVFHINKTYPDTNKESGHIYAGRSSKGSKFSASKTTGFINPEPLVLIIYSKGYELYKINDYKADTITVKLKRKQ